MPEAVLDAAAVQELDGSFGGELLTPDSPGYDTARELFNAMIIPPTASGTSNGRARSTGHGAVRRGRRVCELRVRARAERDRGVLRAEGYARLVAVKDEYDPDNVFKNTNIPPSGA